MRLKPLIWAEGPPIGLYGTAVVKGLSSPWARWHSGTRDGVDAKKTDPVRLYERTTIGGLVGKRSTCTSHCYGPNGIGMRRGPQYKVLRPIHNILRRVSLIRYTCVGHRFSEHCALREAIETDRDTALVSADTPLQLTHMYVCSSPHT